MNTPDEELREARRIIRELHQQRQRDWIALTVAECRAKTAHENALAAIRPRQPWEKACER